jgi:peptidoglycan/LPS O-acetylase OafA/YrhL
LLQNWRVGWKGSFDHTGLGVTWSLAIEEQFYLTLLFVIRRMTPRSLFYLLVAVICAPPILSRVADPRLGSW